MKVWVVGGAGYIGSHVCKALIKAGHEPVVFDNLSTGLRSNVLPGIPFREGDILDLPVLRAAAREFRFDGVVHLAALKAAGESMEVPERYSRANIVGSLNLLESVLEAGIPNFVFSSTAAVYGEPQYLPLDEKHSTKPENYYGHTKLAIEGFIEWYGRLKGLKHVCLRYFNAAGADPEGELGERHDPETHLIPLVLQAASGRRPHIQVFGRDYDTPDGTCIRDYIHIQDLCSAHWLGLQALLQKGGCQAYNLGNGQGFSVQEVIDTAERVTGRKIPVIDAPRRAGDPARLVADARRAREQLGWQPQYADLDTIVAHAWRWEQQGAPG